jgi:glycerol-3-phosphate dehydrogenase (NAD(P)+)
MLTISIIGMGALGSAIASHLYKNGCKVFTWSRNSELCNVQTYEEVVSDSVDGIILATSSSGIREYKIPDGIPLLLLAKGMIDGKYPYTLFNECAILSGPNFAFEIIKGLPWSSVCSSTDSKKNSHDSIADFWIEVLSNKNANIVKHSDILGVSFCGVFKNIIAIYAGYNSCIGENARASAITDGINAMISIGSRLDISDSVYYSYAGVGDVFLTCTSDNSRNYKIGQDIFHKRNSEGLLCEGIKSLNYFDHEFIDNIKKIMK